MERARLGECGGPNISGLLGDFRAERKPAELVNNSGLGGAEEDSGLSCCVSAGHTPKVVLQMVLRMQSTNDSANSNQDWVQSMVSAWESPLLGLGGNLLPPLCKGRGGEG